MNEQERPDALNVSEYKGDTVEIRRIKSTSGEILFRVRIDGAERARCCDFDAAQREAVRIIDAQEAGK